MLAASQAGVSAVLEVLDPLEALDPPEVLDPLELPEPAVGDR